MTITVEADGKTYTGSSVVRVRWRKNDPLSAANGPQWITTVSGEAVVVEIPGRGVLFALLNPPDEYNYATDLAFKALGAGAQRLPINELFDVIEAEQGKPQVLSNDLFPFFITFTNLDDPNSVKRVDPSNFAATFGPGVGLESVVLEITDEPVTEGLIDEELGWMRNQAQLDASWKIIDRQYKKLILGLRYPIRR
ncbi:hypothetical protein [Hoeflea sp. TYP-13]|uniref:hypothetical protein n=1 Tax=Hoeflea sp. TYP-13 TaxID=3230023 RepID=UPI0034C6C95E